MAVFLKLGAANGCQGFRQTNICNGQRVLMAVTKFYYQSFFYSSSGAQVYCLKNNIKIYIKIKIKTVPTCFGADSACTTNSTHAISRHAATSAHNIQRRNFTECFHRSVTLTRLCTSCLRIVEDRNM